METGARKNGTGPQYALAGLETGILASLWMLAWLGMYAAWHRRSFWTASNLLASTFYGEAALRNRFTLHTFSGLALFLVIYGAGGLLFAFLVRRRHGRLLLLAAGILEGIALYYFAFGGLKHLNPLIALYTPDRPMFAGHVLYGALLAFYPRNLRQLWPGTREMTVVEPGIQAADERG